MSSFLPSIQGFLKGSAATAAGLSTVGVGLLLFGQNWLIYPSAFPPGSRTEVPVPAQFGLPYEDLELVTSDDVKIRCYLLLQRRDLDPVHHSEDTTREDADEEFASFRPTVIMFHGNGGNMGHRIPLAKVFYTKMRCNVLMVSYRGYGLSEGSPSEKGIRIDAQTALDYVMSNPTLGRTLIVLYGQSIGGAVSIDLASRNPSAIRALILENTFLSLPRLVPSALPALAPFAFLCHQKWDSASKVPTIPPSTPILMLSGARDEVVPRQHMLELWKLVKAREGQAESRGREAKEEEDEEEVQDVRTGAGSRFANFPQGTHNDTCVQQGYWMTVAEFVAGLGQAPARNDA
ncbi:alpha/beta-hydrolase [Obba rivulosa]|uniref:Alpha/beta-hydrolase n=1 Tax=Obba rivulosa TaxID=1052685 RepID=A0A8E2AH03_9APHY|nr:alpha/beta-hydrolase [Obba rivulosa]